MSAPAVIVWPVKCPSCGSTYNGETHELVIDTGLPARIRELEVETETFRTRCDDLQKKLDVATARIEVLETPAPAEKRERKFIIG